MCHCCDVRFVETIQAQELYVGADFNVKTLLLVLYGFVSCTRSISTSFYFAPGFVWLLQSVNTSYNFAPGFIWLHNFIMAL